MNRDEIKNDVLKKFGDIKEELEVLDTSKLNPIFETWVHETKDMIRRFSNQSTAIDFRINKCCAICATLMEIDNPEIVLNDFVNDKGEIVTYSMYSSPDTVVDQMLKTAQNNLIAALHEKQEIDRTYHFIYEMMLKCFPAKPVTEPTVVEEHEAEVVEAPVLEETPVVEETVEKSPVEEEVAPAEEVVEEQQLELSEEIEEEECNDFSAAIKEAVEAIKGSDANEDLKNFAEEILSDKVESKEEDKPIPKGWARLRIDGMPSNGYIISTNGTIVDRFTGRTLRPYKNHGKTIYRFRNFHTKAVVELTEEEVWLAVVDTDVPVSGGLVKSPITDMLLVTWIPGIPKDKYRIYKSGKMENLYDDRFIKTATYKGRAYYNLTDAGYRGVATSKVNTKIIRVYVDDLLSHFG